MRQRKNRTCMPCILPKHLDLGRLRQHLIELRVKKNLTQKEVADLSSLSNSQVQGVESGRSPMFETIWKLAQFYEVSLDELVNDQ